MKAAPFAYSRPATPQDAAAELAAAGEHGEVKIIAGGQSLLPVLAMRLGRPVTLVDITRIAAWQTVQENERIRIGAGVRQRAVERRRDLGVPLLARALPWIGHREIRSRGTICGSLAHADPASELPAVALTLGATLSLRSANQVRELPAEDFFLGAMTTALGAHEVLQHVEFPRARRGQGFGFAEIARRHGDFALAGVTALVQRDGERIERALLGAFGVADRPQLADVTEIVANLGADDPDADGLAGELADTAARLVTTTGDSHASTAYRRRLVRVLGARELIAAAHRSRLEVPC